MPVARDEVTIPLALEALARGGGLWVREASPSMLPLIRPGDELKLVPLAERELSRGALIAYERAGGLIVHRVIGCNSGGVVVKGDALATLDPPVSRDRVVARVVVLRRSSGRAVSLEAFPWPFLNRLLGTIAALASRLKVEPSGNAAPQLLQRLAWKALRLPFYLARLLLR